MKLLVKNKFFSLKGSSYVKDENDNIVYKVKGKLFSPTKKKKICDTDGRILMSVRNKWWHFFLHSAFIMSEDGNIIAKITRRFSVRSKFDVVSYNDSYRIDGDFLGWNMSVYKNDEYIGNITRKVIALTDTFVIETDNSSEAPFLVALVISLDNITDRAYK